MIPQTADDTLKRTSSSDSGEAMEDTHRHLKVSSSRMSNKLEKLTDLPGINVKKIQRAENSVSSHTHTHTHARGKFKRTPLHTHLHLTLPHVAPEDRGRSKCRERQS
jgi:hypothetical protein